ncbi:hypothetical protein NM688_g619 [Phlebia brevispora]|uniref:Uncharacterized protein n=1 Tax=Phlebia brevispora TaxID=194682 RepID=A0ACC1TEL8_9APHY|nr:hypothetical protein NM688_g619 [Phlebia brevispora]
MVGNAASRLPDYLPWIRDEVASHYLALLLEWQKYFSSTGPTHLVQIEMQNPFALLKISVAVLSLLERHVGARTVALAKALKEYFQIGQNVDMDTLYTTGSLRIFVGDSDIVCLSSPNDIDYPIILWAVTLIGGIVATMNPALTPQEIEYQLKLVQPKLIIAHQLTFNTVKQILQKAQLGIRPTLVSIASIPSNASIVTVGSLVEFGRNLPLPSPEIHLKPGEAKRKIALLCFSSGTTGYPKVISVILGIPLLVLTHSEWQAVAISHYNFICAVLQSAAVSRVNEDYAPWEERRVRPGDVSLGGNVTSRFILRHADIRIHLWLSDKRNLHFMYLSAVTVVVTAQFNFEKMLENIAKYKITTLSIVPPQATLLCKHPTVKSYDLSSVRLCMLAAAPVSAELTAALLSVIPNSQLGQGYGMTEATGPITMFPVSQKVGIPGSGGQLMPGTIARVVKLDGTLSTRGERGELWVKGPQICVGYYKNEEATRETFVDGWLRTGDEVYFDDDGNIFVVDRIKEIMKVKGFQVSPAELEGHLLTHPAVGDVGVVGVPDDYSGEVPVAFVVPSSAAAERMEGSPSERNAMEAEIKKHVSDAKSRYKWLSEVYFVEAIPKNPSGKILRRVMREKIQDLFHVFQLHSLANLYVYTPTTNPNDKNAEKWYYNGSKRG